MPADALQCRRGGNVVPTASPTPDPDGDDLDALIGHPRGTLAIVVVFGALFLAGWLAMFLLRFVERGVPHH
jgi:hypothetical protein